MRLHLLLSSSSEIIPYNYQEKLLGTFHKWLGLNELHDEISLYSWSWLQGSGRAEGGLAFPEGAKWFISFWDESIGSRIINGVMKDPAVFSGMEVKEIQIQNTPQFSCREVFKLASPVLIRKYENGRAMHLTYESEEATHYLSETLKKKLKTAGLNNEVRVSFDKSYLHPKTKLIDINGIKSRANYCPIVIEGDPEAICFAWNVGTGHSTGCGFGAMY